MAEVTRQCAGDRRLGLDLNDGSGLSLSQSIGMRLPLSHDFDSVLELILIHFFGSGIELILVLTQSQ